MTNYLLNAFELFFSGLGLGLSDSLILILICLSVIFSISDYRIGLIMLFLGSVSFYIFFTLFGLDVARITIMLFISLILLAFSLFTSRQGGKLV